MTSDVDGWKGVKSSCGSFLRVQTFFFLDPSGCRCIVHTTLMENLDVISLDQGDGRIVEFPLMPVTSARQAVLHAGKFYYVDSERQKHMPSGIDHVVVIMLIRHKLVFLFDS